MTARLIATALVAGCMLSGCNLAGKPSLDSAGDSSQPPRVRELQNQLDLARRELAVRDSRIEELTQRSDRLSHEIRRLTLLNTGQEGMIETLRQAAVERDEYRNQLQELRAATEDQKQRLAQAEAENKILRLRLQLPLDQPLTAEPETPGAP